MVKYCFQHCLPGTRALVQQQYRLISIGQFDLNGMTLARTYRIRFRFEFKCSLSNRLCRSTPMDTTKLSNRICRSTPMDITKQLVVSLNSVFVPISLMLIWLVRLYPLTALQYVRISMLIVLLLLVRLNNCRFTLEIISKSFNGSQGYIRQSGGRFYDNLAENHKKSIFFVVSTTSVKLIWCFTNIQRLLTQHNEDG